MGLSCIAGRFFTSWANIEAQKLPRKLNVISSKIESESILTYPLCQRLDKEKVSERSYHL